MKLKQYPKYKDSGIQWIGEIPEEWETRKLKHLVNEFISGGTPNTDNKNFWANEDEEGINWIAIADMTNHEFIKTTNKKITLDGLVDKGLKILKKGTLIYSIFASLGKVSILEIDATTNQAILGLITSKKIDHIFLKYYLRDLEEPIIALSNANTQNNLNSTIVKNIDIVIPENSKEQKLIADFLDKKITEINSLLKRDKQLIELLKEKRITLINQVVTKGLNPKSKLKDSGIDWIGKVPEHWEVRKLKNVTDIKISNVDKKSNPNEPEVELCNYTDVYYNEFITDKLNFMKATCSYEQKNKFLLQKEDVMITKDSEIPEDIAVPAVSKENFKDVVCGYHLAFIRSNRDKLSGEYLFRLLQSKSINAQFIIWALGVTRFGISTYPIKNSFVLIPPKTEQTQIVEYLDKATTSIDITIKKIKKRMKLLAEYKKSLIHNVVTGKVDVRNEK